MLSGYEHTLTNLRLLKGLEKKEYLQTCSEGNIIAYLGDTFITNIASALYRDNWSSTLFCLHRIYVEECPKLVTKLIKENAEKELKKIKVLLDDSRVGLKNLKTVYSENQYVSHLDTLIDDYLNTQLDHIEEFLEKKPPVKSEDLNIPTLKRSLTTINED